MKRKTHRFLLPLLFVLQAGISPAQPDRVSDYRSEFLLGPGFGTNRNKTIIQSHTKRYKLTPFNQDFKLDMGVIMDRHFYLNAGFNIYRQDIYRDVPPVVTGLQESPVTGLIASSYTYTSRYKYHGITLVPCYLTGNKVKFFAGLGFNLDFARIDGNTVHVTENHYSYDSTGQYHFNYSTTRDTLNDFVERRGSDFSGLAQTGVLFNLGKSLVLQVNAYFRRSLELTSLEAPKDFKSNAGLSVSVLYRIWGRAGARTEPVE